MTDKQIIIKNKEVYINGVDVSGCIYFKKNNKMSMCRACNSGVGTPYCEYHKDCYYKQLKRKEQECEKINLTNERLVAEKYIMNEEILKLKRKEQECDKYKAALDEIKRYRVCEINDEDGEEGDVILGIIDETKEQNDGQTNIL